MSDANPASLLPLRTNWLHILLSLADQERHGYGIMLDVLERTDDKVRLWPATLYGTIKRMIEAGLIAESKSRPSGGEDDARRRYYRITSFGKRVLDLECQRLEDLVRVVRAKRKEAFS